MWQTLIWLVAKTYETYEDLAGVHAFQFWSQALLSWVKPVTTITFLELPSLFLLSRVSIREDWGFWERTCFEIRKAVLVVNLVLVNLFEKSLRTFEQSRSQGAHCTFFQRNGSFLLEKGNAGPGDEMDFYHGRAHIFRLLSLTCIAVSVFLVFSCIFGKLRWEYDAHKHSAWKEMLWERSL